MKKTITESQLRNIIAESIKKTLNEFIAGGNDWGNTYPDYQRMNYKTNGNDNIVRELHTICQYADDLYNAVYNNQPSRYFPRLQPEYLSQAYELIQPIYGLMANRTNRAGDAHAMSIEEIKQECLPSLRQLSQMKELGTVCSAASRACQELGNC